MAINVDFYLLAEPTLAASRGFICRLLEKIYLKGQKVMVYVSSENQANELNDELWTFRDISFVPHSIYQENLPAPIQISYSEQQAQDHDILLNLREKAAETYTNFKRILEIVPNSSTLKSANREKYKYYQQQGCKLKTHDMSHHYCQK